MKGATVRDEHLTAKQVHRLVDQRGSRKMDLRQVQSSLYYASKKTDKITIHKVKGKFKTYTYNHTLGELFGDFNYSQDDSFFDENIDDLLYDPKKMPKIEHKINATKGFEPSNFIKYDKKEPRDALVSTVQHHFTAEQLLDSLNNLNPDLHDDVIVAIFDALGKNNYSPINYGSMLTGEPQPRKTALLSWAFIDGNLVVKE